MARHQDVASSPLPGTGRRIVVSQRGRLRILDGAAELGRCELRSRTGEFEFVAPAPDAGVAVARWSDQTEAGLVLAGLEDTPRQLDAAWETRETNWLEGPVWSPDSRALVLTENPAGAGPWWAGPEGDDDDISPGAPVAPLTRLALGAGQTLRVDHMRRDPLQSTHRFLLKRAAAPSRRRVRAGPCRARR